MSCRIGIHHRIIITVSEHIVAVDVLTCFVVDICIYETAGCGVIVTALEIVEACFVIVNITAITQRLNGYYGGVSAD